MCHFVKNPHFVNSSRLCIRSCNWAPSWISPWSPWLPTHQIQERYQGFRRCSCLWPLRWHPFDWIYLQSRGALIVLMSFREYLFSNKVFFFRVLLSRATSNGWRSAVSHLDPLPWNSLDSRPNPMSSKIVSLALPLSCSYFLVFSSLSEIAVLVSAVRDW